MRDQPIHNRLLWRIIQHLIYWLLIWSVLPLFITKNPTDYFNQIKFFGVSLPFDIMAVYISFYWLIPAFLQRKKVFTFITLYLITGTFFILVQRIFVYYFVFPEEWAGHPFIKELPAFILINFLILGLSLTIKLVKLWYTRNQEYHRLRHIQLNTELKLKEAELNLLKAQLHPHFLFNTLNNLYGLTLEKSDIAPTVVLKISAILDYMMSEAQHEAVPISKEINYIKDYIELEKLRFGDQLHLDFIVNGQESEFNMAPLILIPFIENAFKHARSANDKPVDISIQITVSDDKLFFLVENSMEGDSIKESETSHHGVGLANVQKRLELIYPDAHILQVKNRGSRFQVKLELNQKPIYEKRR